MNGWRTMLLGISKVMRERKSEMVKHLRSTRGNATQKKRAVTVSNSPGHIKSR